MDQGNQRQYRQQQQYQQYQQYQSYDYDQAPPRQRNIMDKILGDRLSDKLRSPLVATLGLLLVGAAFAAVIVGSYPKSGNQAVPVIKADSGTFKMAPGDTDGTIMPGDDSTIYAQVPPSELDASAPVENLLGENQEKPVDKLQALAEQAEAISQEEDNTPPKPVILSALPTEDEGIETAEESTPPPVRILSIKREGGEESESVQEQEEVADTSAAEEEALPAELEAIKPEIEKTQKIAMTTEKIAPQAKPGEKVASIAHPPEKLHAAGSSPETLAYVRSVLDQKEDAPSTASDASRVASIEPAAGAPISAGAGIAPGDYYVQVGSVTSRSGADGEWGKIQKAFASDLSGLSYRVQEANLGERGTYYRIQAGPMSKDSAAQICSSIKAQKPSGCMVVK